MRACPSSATPGCARCSSDSFVLRRARSTVSHVSRFSAVLIGACCAAAALPLAGCPRCSQDQVQQNGKCVARCNADSDCARDEHCAGGGCAAGAATVALSILPTHATLAVGQTQTFTAGGGRAPYRFSVVGGPGD